MNFIHGRKLGLKIAEKLGLDPHCITDITITMALDDVVRVEVSLLATDEVAEVLEFIVDDATNLVPVDH